MTTIEVFLIAVLIVFTVPFLKPHESGSPASRFGLQPDLVWSACVRCVLIAVLGLLVSCGGGGQSDSSQSPSPPPPPPPPPPSPPGNVNTNNPTLTVANNSPVTSGGALRLVWSDEFNAAQLDPEDWYFETGDGSQYGIPGWGNNELQWYLPDSAALRNGSLVITARKEAQGGKSYTSARINTRDRFAFRYGRIEARIKMPKGQGVWPAFWLMPQDNAYGTWAASGEIDIVEAPNAGALGGNTIFGVLHYGGQWPNNASSGESYVASTDITADFHTYVLEWDRAEMRWYVDSTLFAVQNTWFTTAAPFPAPFDQRFYILLNFAVGGNFPGPPAASTVFPVTMEVDYVRVYSGNP